MTREKSGMNSAGKVYLVGAGPGDPDLLTLKAARILAQADVVVYDRLVTAEVLELVNPAACLVYAGKRQGEQEAIQYAINQWLLESAQAGYTVVRLKSGDPMVFGRGGEELEFLAENGIDVEVVPGISSAISFSSLAGIPLTFRGVAASFAVVAGHRQAADELDWGQYARIDTLIVLMGVENRNEIARQLVAAGRSAEQPVAFVQQLSTPNESIVETNLGELARGSRVNVEAPAVFVIGEVVNLRHKLTLTQTREAVA
jgi:uroporphyrin-III C-methyltransferase